jgi:hypothetical protein
MKLISLLIPIFIVLLYGNSNTKQILKYDKDNTPCKYIFINKYNANGIKIEVHIGNDNRCENNKSQGEFSLKQDEEKDFSSLEDCCYRKSLDNGNTWTDFINISHCHGNGAELEIDL